MQLLYPSARPLSVDDLRDLYDLPGPHVRADFVASLDGVIALGGTSDPLGTPADKAAFAALRAVSDAVIVGAGTARAEDYGPVRFSSAAAAWRAAHQRAEVAPLVIVSRSGLLPEGARFREGPLIVAVPEGVAVSGPVTEVIHETEPHALIAALHERGFTRLLCEGGPSLLTAFLSAGCLDELCLTTSPLAVGDGPRLLGALPGVVSLELRSLVHDDPGVLLQRWGVVRSLDE
ncbi:MAG: bifunctional deaminase-reductase domain protein [Frankiales bacterium]|nr:bifunctional deaminase-reductase domain protein [Frankiales bacterium]